jgi:cation transport ATPase
MSLPATAAAAPHTAKPARGGATRRRGAHIPYRHHGLQRRGIGHTPRAGAHCRHTLAGLPAGRAHPRIEASEEAYAPALDAIRKAGFDPQPAAGRRTARAGGHDHEEHGTASDHSDHSHDSGFGSGATRLIAALVLAAGAETVSFFAPELLAWKIAGMAVAALAIGLAGLDTYKKGWPPCCAASSTSTR